LSNFLISKLDLFKAALVFAPDYNSTVSAAQMYTYSIEHSVYFGKNNLVKIN